MARHFANWIDAYVDHTRISEAPTVFHFWTAVATIAGALRRRVWIDEFSYKWYPNFYIVFVGPAGVVTKSTTLGRGMALLSKVPDVNIGPSSVTWQKLIKILGDISQEVTYIDDKGRPDIITSSSITIPVSEFGTFLKTEDSVMLDVLTHLWDSPDGPWKHATLTGGDNMVENPWINIVGCTTPSWIKEHFREHMIGGGLASRIIFIYGEKKQRLVAYPSQLINPDKFRERERLLVEDLTVISKLKGRFRFTPEAYKWGTRWYEQHHEEERPTHLASDRYSGYLQRKQTHIHKTAMVLSTARRDDLIIEQGDLAEALSLIDSVEPAMGKVFDQIGQVGEARRTNEMVQFVKTYKVLTAEQLWICVRNIMPKKEFEENLRTAVGTGILKVVMHQGKKAVRLSEDSPSPPSPSTP